MIEKEQKSKLCFWQNILRSVHTSPHFLSKIRGGSGLQHDVIAAGIDESKKRLIVVSGEHDGRTAALVQADIQAAFTNYRVLTIRPAVISVPKLAKALQNAFGTSVLAQEFFATIQKDKSFLISFLDQTINLETVLKNVPLQGLAQIMEFIQQAARLNITKNDFDPNDIQSSFSIDLNNVMNYDPIAVDRLAGVCGFPLYNFSQNDIDAISSASTIESVIQTLRSHDIYQYFFPGPDNLALGLVEKGVHRSDEILSEVQKAPVLGHPLGEMEIVDSSLEVFKIIDALAERKFLTEGEFGFDLSDEGKKARMTVKFKPKEGIISKIISQFSLKIDLKDFFKPDKEN